LPLTRRGILHRDLKPGNIMLSGGKLVKVLDFGLAKLLEPARFSDETGTARRRSCTILRELPRAWWSARRPTCRLSRSREELGPASDVFSFGCVLYEMLTGRSAFGGENTITTIAAVLNRAPRLVRELRPDVPEVLSTIVSACLTKDPAARAALADVRQALDDLRQVSRGHTTSRPMFGARASRASRITVAAALLVTIVAAAAIGWRWRTTSAPPSAPLTVLRRLTSDAGLTAFPALSPDGKMLAFASDRAGEGAMNIWMRQLAGGETIRLTRGANDDREPSFSSDGSQIAFSSDRNGGGIFVMSALGGEPRQIANEGRRPRFSPDGRWIAFFTGPRSNSGENEKIYLVPTAAVRPRPGIRSSPPPWHRPGRPTGGSCSSWRSPIRIDGGRTAPTGSSLRSTVAMLSRSVSTRRSDGKSSPTSRRRRPGLRRTTSCSAAELATARTSGVRHSLRPTD
jgi:hypothetical protein